MAQTSQRLRSIDIPDGWKSPIRFAATAIGEDYGQIVTPAFESAGSGLSPARSLMSSQKLIEEIMLDAVPLV